MTTNELLSPSFLFRFSVACRYAARLWPMRGAPWLTDEYLLRGFGELDRGPSFADLRVAWNDAGIGFEVRVTGKRQPAWCRESRVEDSDGLQVWIDTRDTHNVHRANRFCHRLLFLPAGAGARFDQPHAVMLPIHRARELPKPIEPGQLQVASQTVAGGYAMRCFVPGGVLTGYDPNEHTRLGFFYAVVDRELGWQTFSVGPEFPFPEDPSLWGTLELRREG